MRSILSSLIVILLLSSCKENKEFEFDRKALLTEVAVNQIIPQYESLVAGLEALDAAIDNFQLSPVEVNLTEVRTQFSNAYTAFERVKMFEFGPAETYGFRSSTNTYPTDTTQITHNIETGSYSLGAVVNAAAIGLPAVDFLINKGSNDELLLRFTSDPFASNRFTYLSDLSEKMKNEATTILSTWNSSYKTTFINEDGTAINSSLSILFNQFVVDLELVKNAKIGIPAGQFSGGEPFPLYAEGLYFGASKSLALTNLIALKAVFKGGTGIGMDDYMDASVEFGTTTVPSSEISNQFDVCISKIEALNDPFSASVNVDAAGFTIAYQELKKLVAYAKTDIPAALGVLISFSDTDGD